MIQPRLVIEGRGNWVYTQPLGDAERVTIGRSGDNEIRLQDLHSSSRHAEIVRDDEGYMLRDLGSRNGTFLNGKKVQEARLKNGSQIKIGITTMSFLTGEDDSFAVSSSMSRSQAGLGLAAAPESVLDPMLTRLDGLKNTLGKAKAGAPSSDVLAAAVEDLQLELREARATIHRLTITNEFARLLAAQESPLQLVAAALQFMAQRVGGESGFIMQVDPLKKKWVVRARHGVIEDWARQNESEDKKESPVSLTIVEEVVRTGEAVVSNCAKEDPRFDESKSVLSLGILSCMCRPMLAGGRAVGVTYVDRRMNPEPFSMEDQKLFEALTAQLNQVLYPPELG